MQPTCVCLDCAERIDSADVDHIELVVVRVAVLLETGIERQAAIRVGRRHAVHAVCASASGHAAKAVHGFHVQAAELTVVLDGVVLTQAIAECAGQPTVLVVVTHGQRIVDVT